GDHVLHLHRLDDGDLLAPAHLVADGDVDGDDGALDRRGDPGRTVRSGQRDRVVTGAHRRVFGLHLGIVREQRERVATLHARAGEPAVVRCGAHGLHETAALIRTLGDKRGQVLVDPAGMETPGGEVVVRQDVAQEWDVGGYAVQAELAERARGPSD